MGRGNPNIREVSKATQFKPGQSGNPAGMPKGIKHISTWINQMLNDPEFTTHILEGYQLKEYKGAPLKAIIGTQIRLALSSKDELIRIKATDLLMKHAAPQKLLLGNDPDNPLTNTNKLSEEELRDRLREIVSSTKGGSKSDTSGAR